MAYAYRGSSSETGDLARETCSLFGTSTTTRLERAFKGSETQAWLRIGG